MEYGQGFVFVGKFLSLDLVNIIVFGVNNICRVIVFFMEKCYWIDYTGEPSQREVLVKALFHHFWYLVERQKERDRQREFDMEGIKSLLVFQKDKFHCSRPHMNLRDICSHCD